MENSAFDLGEHLSNRKLTYKASPLLWSKWDVKEIDLAFSNWKIIKFLNDKGNNFHNDILKVPNNKGGLYMFFVKCEVLPGITELPMYIGRAQITKGQNLRKRVKEYYTKFAKEKERPKITLMFKYWATDIHLAYYELDDNCQIIDLEKKLINSTLLPMNDAIPDKIIRDAVKAFNL